MVKRQPLKFEICSRLLWLAIVIIDMNLQRVLPNMIREPTDNAQILHQKARPKPDSDYSVNCTLSIVGV